MPKRKKRINHRNRIVAFKLTKDEYKMLKFFAKLNGLTAPKWARELVLRNANVKRDGGWFR
jgi:hypothetical protein